MSRRELSNVSSDLRNPIFGLKLVSKLHTQQYERHFRWRSSRPWGASGAGSKNNVCQLISGDSYRLIGPLVG